MKFDIPLKQVSLWHMVPIALGLHGILAVLPVSTVDTRNSQKAEAIPVVIAPPARKSIVPVAMNQSPAQPQPTSLKAKSTPPLTATPQPQAKIAVQSKPVIQPPAEPEKAPETKTPETPPQTPTPSPEKALEKTAEKPPEQKPENVKKNTPDFQQGCNSLCGEWTSGDWYSNIIKLQQTLEQQGYTLHDVNDKLDEEHGIRALLADNGQESFYLLIVQGDDGAQRFLRSPDLLTTRDAVLDRISTELARDKA